MSARSRRAASPLATLGAVVLLTVVLFAANSRVDPAASTAPAYPGTGGAETSTAPPSAEPTPEPPAEPTPAPSPPAALQAVYAGVTSGGEATIAMAVDDDQVAAYLCDGAAIEAWLQGTVDGDTVTLTGRNGAGLSGSVTDGAVFGTVTTSSGLTLPFSAAESQPPAGVYESRTTLDGLATRIGWAVLPDGTQVGVATVGDTKREAPPLDLTDGSFEIDGSPGTAEPVDGSDTVVGG
ncbi:hypothetical protein JOD57_004783 [Geodermatophilus bullaregiensis]|uniref:hypothetical protein n=1 Tax=Geodermatophilus bullaregiensis TaxID=1564160 RepID=UPI00195A61C2|nr:hypothetical protein [Geodermatophilus bullaregiensis]MBM7808946.1 hypothetical protein [Geodermatophilus bullaregiensis]